MKGYFLLVATFLFVSSTFAQIRVGTPKIGKMANFKLEEWENYKTLKTYFVIRESDKKNRDLIESILQEVWKFNQYEIIDFDQYKLMPEDGSAIFFGLRNYNTNVQYTPNSDLAGKFAQSNNLKIQLWRNLPNKKHELITEDVLACMIVTSPTSPNFRSELLKRRTADAFEYVCKSNEVVQEWDWGFLKNNLQLIERHLRANESRWEFKSEVEKEKTYDLKSEILYVPSNIDWYYESNNASPFEKYSGKEIVFISPKDLSNKILNSGTKFYYLQLLMLENEKVVTVINSVSGEYIYSEYSILSHFFCEKDIKELNKAIK